VANIVEQAIIELQSVYKGGGAEKAKKDLANLKRELKSANGSVQRLQSSLKQLNRVPIAFDDQRAMGGAGGQTTPRKAAIFAANEALRKYFSTIRTGARQLAATEAGLKAQAAAFSNVAANAKKGGDLYKGAIESQVRAEQKLRLAQIERIKVEQQLYATGRVRKTDAFKGVEELLAYGKTLPQTTSALSIYQNELQKTLGVVEIGGEKYKKLRAEIERVSEVMKGPQATKKGLAGLKESLADAKREQQELVVGRGGTKEWVEATVRVKKAQFEYNKELAKSRIGTALINADINGTAKALSLAKQAAKGGLGMVAGGIGSLGKGALGLGKKALGTRFGQIGAARGIDALAKKVPVVDKAFGRLLQKIPLLGKFLNENISVNARWTARVLEGITGVTAAWNGLSQIISAAQAFTAFERQAAIAINSVARMFKDMYNLAGAMMMGLISPGQVGKNLWDKALDRPDVMAARRGPSSIERLEFQLAKKKAELKNTEIKDEGRLQVISRQVLEIESAITDETRQRILLAKQYQDAMMKGPVWTQYDSPAGPGSKGAGWGSNAQARLADVQSRIAERISPQTLDDSGIFSQHRAARTLLLEERKINTELARRKEILRVLHQGIDNINLSVQEQRDLFGTSNRESLEALREASTTQSPLAMRRNPKTQWKGPVSNEAWARYQRMQGFRKQKGERLREGLMLGAGFPVLFGGGVGSVAGGTTGALMQHKMGPGAGFGAQILLSAVGQSIDAFVVKTAEMGKALGAFTQDTGALTEAMGLAGTAEGKRIKLIEQLKGEQAAFNAAVEQLTATIGEVGVQRLRDFGDAWTNLMVSLQNKLLKVQSALAGVLLALDKIIGVSKGGLNDRKMAFARQFGGADIQTKIEKYDKLPDSFKYRKEKAKLEKEIFEGTDTAFYKMQGETQLGSLTENTDKITEKLKEQKEIQEEVNSLKMDYGINEKLAKTIAEETYQIELEKSKLMERLTEVKTEIEGLDEKEIERKKRLEGLQKAIKKDIEGQVIAYDNVARAAIAADKETKKIKVTWEEIKGVVAGGMTDAVLALTDASKSLGDVLASVAKSLGRMFLNAAFNNILGSFSFGGSGLGPGSAVNRPPSMRMPLGAEGAYWTNGIKPFATGGLVTRPTIGLVGEAGEDEYIIPASKMSGAMERYSAGARGQAVIPGGGTVASGSGVRSTPTVVNYTGPVLSFNSEAYVPKSAIPEIINSAARRGAQEGQSKVFSQLKNSRSQRSRVGL